jgi:acyl dehydratase
VRFFEDFAVGYTMELGSYPPLTEEAIIAFGREWDPQPFHTDPERAKASIFGGLIASGWHTGAIAMRLLCDGLLNHARSQGSPGLDQIRFLRPVRPGDVLSGRYTVLVTEPSPRRPTIGRVKGRTELRNQRDELVLTIEAWGMFDRRAA